MVATDASVEQIGSAEALHGVQFLIAQAEASALAAASVDLITVAQALHWFNIDSFFDEARRVLKPDGVLAAWCYHRCHVNPECDEIIDAILDEVDAYWPPQREIVENRYHDISMPFTEIAVGPFSMTASWTAIDALDYMRTWSASQRYLRATGDDPMRDHARALISRWGEGRREVAWPLILRVGRK